jgi:hypothetical protein
LTDLKKLQRLDHGLLERRRREEEDAVRRDVKPPLELSVATCEGGARKVVEESIEEWDSPLEPGVGRSDPSGHASRASHQERYGIDLREELSERGGGFGPRLVPLRQPDAGENTGGADRRR